jgi:hypothetical protein
MRDHVNAKSAGKPATQGAGSQRYGGHRGQQTGA